FLRPGERDEANLRMPDDQVTDLASRSGNEVDDAGRHADLVQQVHEPSRDHRRVARRLEHDGVAAHDRRPRHSDHDGAREIPGWDYSADAERYVHELVLFARQRYDGLRPRVPQRPPRIVFEKIDRLRDIAVCFDPALADFVDE